MILVASKNSFDKLWGSIESKIGRSIMSLLQLLHKDCIRLSHAYFFLHQTTELIDIENLYKINDNRCDDILCQYLKAFYWSTLVSSCKLY